MRQRCLLWIALLWLLTVGWGMMRLTHYGYAAGAASRPPARWPLGTKIPRNPARPTLIMLAHPRCPCTRASLAELSRLMALCPGRASAVVLFLSPHGYSSAWTQTGLWREAAAIPGVRVLADRDGKLAERLGARTSGALLLYAPDGRLLYQGGLTGSRGHEGENAGLDSLAALLNGETPSAVRTPVYGCPLTPGRSAQPSAATGARACPR